MNLQIRIHLLTSAAVLVLLSTAIISNAQNSSFTYQGRLGDGGNAATGNYDLQFALFDSLAAGNLVGTAQTVSNVSVTAGIFTVQLDFGASSFPGANRWLEIRARLSGAATFTTLAPRQPITSTPYAVRSLVSSTADAVTVGGVPGGSGNYIQNGTTQQAGANFNITGNGTAGGAFTATQFNTCQVGTGCSNIIRVLSTPGVFNTFVGHGTGQDLTTGGGNTFVGDASGLGTTTGIGNSFFGLGSGRVNTIGEQNTILGWVAELGANNLINATAIGARATVAQNNSLVLGSINGINGATSNVNVGIGTNAPLATLDTRGTMLVSLNVGIGTTTPTAPLDVNGAGVFRPAGLASPRATSFGSPNGETGMTINGPSNRADVRFDGTTLKLLAAVGTGPPAPTNGIVITTVGSVGIGTTTPFLNTKLDIVGGFLRLDSLAGGGDESLCRNSAAHTLATCSSSLRYKERIASYTPGLQLINRLRPITFSWKESGRPDLGLGAEDVAKVEPLLVTRNQEGAVEGVKYDRLNLVLINAIKEQQKQIEELRAQNAALNSRLRSVESVVVRKQKRGRAKRLATTW